MMHFVLKSFSVAVRNFVMKRRCRLYMQRAFANMTSENVNLLHNSQGKRLQKSYRDTTVIQAYKELELWTGGV